MPIAITENGPDLLLTNTKTHQHMYLRNPTWEDLLDTLRDFINRDFTDGDENEPGSPTGPIVGEYDYVWQFREHELTFYPRRATPDGWIATHLGTEFKHYVEVREDGAGTISMIRDDLEKWTSTDLPEPGEFFEELQAVSGHDTPNLEWSSDDIAGEIVAVVDPEPDGKNEIEVRLYRDSWGKSMRVFVTGSSPW